MQSEEKDMKAFDTMTDAEKRVAVARDVIAQLDAKRLIANTNNYISIVGLGDYADMATDSDLGIPMEKLLAGKTCRVCALGALFVAKADRFNGITVTESHTACGWSEITIRNGINDIFEPDQLDMIEAGYEGTTDIWSLRNKAGDEDILAAGNAFAKYPDASERLRAIMSNIIANNGTFVP